MPAFRNIPDAWQVFPSSLSLLSFSISGPPHLQQSNYPMCQSCLKKDSDLCLLHSLPYGCLLLPDQIKRNQKPKLHPTLKLSLPEAPVHTWEKALWQTGHDGQWTGCLSLQHALAGEGDVSLSLWTSSSGGLPYREYCPIPLLSFLSVLDTRLCRYLWENLWETGSPFLWFAVIVLCMQNASSTVFERYPLVP